MSIKKIGVVFSLSQDYIDYAKTFLMSFVSTNTKYEYYYYAYAWNASDDLSELSSICKNITYKVLEPQPQYLFSTTDTAINCHRNNMYVRDVKAVDDVLELGYDLVIHVDIDMLCIKSVENILCDLMTRDDCWEIAGASEENISSAYEHEKGYPQPYQFLGNYKLNFGFLILNPKTVSHDNITHFKKWYDLYGDDLGGCSEVYFSLQYEHRVRIPEVNFFVFNNEASIHNACILHYVGSTRGQLPSPWNDNFYEAHSKLLNFEIYDCIYFYFAKLAKCSPEFLYVLKRKLKITNPRYNAVSKYGLTYTEAEIARLYGIEFVINSLGTIYTKYEPCCSTSIDIGKSICFTSVVTTNYLDACYVMLHSLFKFNAITKFKLFYINATDEELKKAQSKFSNVSTNIEVIKLNEPIRRKNFKYHWKSECMDTKVRVIDLLTLHYDLTVLLDIDTLIQGNFRDTLMATQFSKKHVFGVSERAPEDNILIPGATHTVGIYLNAGFLIFKKSTYNFYERYLKYCTQVNTILSEQDFISYTMQDDICPISAVNNFIGYAKERSSFSDCILLHYCGYMKPYVSHVKKDDYDYRSSIFSGTTLFHGIYRNYVQSIKGELSDEFVKHCEDLPKSEVFREYNDYILSQL